MFFSRATCRFLLAVFILSTPLVFLAPLPASAVDLMLGWTRSDVGLDGNDEGMTVSVANYLPMGQSGSFDMGIELAYVQRSGSQPAFFNSSTLGIVKDERQLTLHVIQPAVTLGYSLSSGNWKWRAYAGGAIGLKLNESWDLPEGDWLDKDPYGYEDIDFLVMAGLSAKMGWMLFDLRYCAGLTEQLILRTDLDYPTTKADDLLPGVHDPEAGARVSNFHLGVGIEF